MFAELDSNTSSSACFRSFPNPSGQWWISPRKGGFKFENMWLETVGFVESVQNWWDCYTMEESASFHLA